MIYHLPQDTNIVSQASCSFPCVLMCVLKVLGKKTIYGVTMLCHGYKRLSFCSKTALPLLAESCTAGMMYISTLHVCKHSLHHGTKNSTFVHTTTTVSKIRNEQIVPMIIE